jgi:hypothetical protein
MIASHAFTRKLAEIPARYFDQSANQLSARWRVAVAVSAQTGGK